MSWGLGPVPPKDGPDRSRGARRGRRTVAGVEFVKLGAGRYETDGAEVTRDESSGGGWLLWGIPRSGDLMMVGSLHSAAVVIRDHRAASADMSTPPACPPLAGGVDGSAGAPVRGPVGDCPSSDGLQRGGASADPTAARGGGG